MKLDPISPAAGVLALADVVLEVEGAALAGDESVGLRDDERVDYWHLVSMKHIGDTLTLKILRQGQVGGVTLGKGAGVGAGAAYCGVRKAYACLWVGDRERGGWSACLSSCHPLGNRCHTSSGAYAILHALAERPAHVLPPPPWSHPTTPHHPPASAAGAVGELPAVPPVPAGGCAP